MTRCTPKSRARAVARHWPCFARCLTILIAGVWPLAASLLQFGCVSQAAEVEASPTPESPLVYRRIYVPADKLDAWPREGQKFIPIEAREFEAWVYAANRAADGRERAATIDSATYSAALEDDGRFHGRGQWSISARGSQPSFLPLSHTTLTLRDLRWRGAAKEPARLGAWGDSEQASKHFGMQVPRSGTLEFDWSIPTRAGRDAIEIPWRVPTAVSTRLTLDLPDGREPAIDGAAVLESTAMLPDPASDNKPRRRWLLAVGSTPTATLRIKSGTLESGQQAVNSADPFTLHETTNYRIEQRGVEFTSTWVLEGLDRNQRELSVPVPRGVQVTSATIDDRELDWQFFRNAAPGTDRAIIALPTSKGRSSVQIVVSAWHPLVLDRAWQLPVLRPDGAFWSSGQIELAIAPEFELQSLSPLECAHNGATQFGADAAKPEVYSLIAYSPAATVEAAITRRQPDATLRAGSSLVLADQDVSGRLATEWNVARTGLHRLSGQLAAGWSVETIETIPTDALAEWFIDRRGNRRQIEIQLTDAVGPARNVTVVVMGRLQRFSLAEPIPADTLRMVHWSGARVARHLLTFQSSKPFTVEPVGELPALPRDSVTDFDRELLDAAADDHPVVDLARAGSGAGLQLTFKRGTYSADVELHATYTGSELRQLYRITAQPKANAIDRLLIYSTSPLAKNTRWIEKSSDAPLTADRLPTDDPQYRDLPKEGELWLLRLPRPAAGTIEVLASAMVAWPQHGESPPLLAFPEAAAQRGRVIVRSLADKIPSIEPVGLIPSPRPSDEPAADRPDDASLIRAAFRFDPAECLKSPRAPRLWIGAAGENETNPLVARYLDLESFCWPDGRATHRATYELENFGTSEFTPTLPPDARLTCVSVNGQSQGVPHSDTKGLPATIHLSPQSGTATVAVYFETKQSPLAAGGAIHPPLVRNGVPLLAGEWTVWLPKEYSASAASQSGGSPFDWQRRLFGPFARSSDVAPFHPLQISDWARVVNGIAGWTSASARDSGAFIPTERAPSELSASATATGTERNPLDANASESSIASRDSAQPSTSDNSLPGWRAFHETFVADDSPTPITVLHPPATAAWSAAILFSAFLLGHRLCRERGTLLLILASIAACLALLLPPALAPLSTGALWGLLFAYLAEWPRQLLSLDRAGNGGGQVPLVGILAVAAALNWTPKSFAENANHQPAAQPPARIERVLIPIDADRRPAGTKYFVSEPFLRELLASSSEQAATKNQWLLVDAAYSGELISQRDQADIVAGTWSLSFSLETFARDTTIVLPLARDEANWQPTAMLDGVPLPLRWFPANGGCALDIEQPGRYSLTIFCVPKTAIADGRSHLRLTVPPLVAATFRLRAPAALTGITVPGAALAPASKASPGVLGGEFGPASQLAVEWPQLEPKSGAAQGATVTALDWLHVGEERTELETKYIIEGGARRPETLALSYDERWKPVTTSPSTDEQTSADASTGRRILNVPLTDPIDGRQEVSLRWRLAGVPSAGAVRLPPIELSSIVPTQHWFALSADPSLDCTIDNKSATSATAKEFLGKWGGSPASTPQLVIPNFDPVRNRTLTVRPHAAESTVREVLHAAIGKKSMRVVYQAHVTPDARNKYSFQLTAPAELSVDEIAVTAGERRIPIRWVRDANGHINIFFGENAASDYRLSLTGAAPLVSGEPSPLPRVSASGGPSSTQQLQLYRDDDVQVDFQGLSPAEESSAGLSDLPPVQWLVRPLGIYHLDEAATTAGVVATNSQPDVAGDSLTILSREGGAWWATFRCRLAVQSGALDVLRLRIPAAWTGPFDIESSVPVTTEVTRLDERRRILAIRVATTIAKGGHFDVRIRAPLASLAGFGPYLPDIAIDLPTEGHRYAIVPASLDSQSIAWTEIGVRATDVPPVLLPATVDGTKQRQLEIVDELFRVSVNTRASRQASPRIRLADTTVSIGDRGGRLIVTRLVLASDGLAECTVQLPADDELVSVQLDGQPALYSALDATHWRIVLGAADLPQLLEIVTRSAGNESSGSRGDLRRPALLAGIRSIPVEVSLWTIAEPRQTVGVQVADAAKVSPLDQAALRIDRFASIVEAATAAAAEAPAPDGDNWLRAWAALVRDVQTRTRRIKTQPVAGPAAAQVSRTSEEQLDRASKRLDDWQQKFGAQSDGPAAAAASAPRPVGPSLVSSQSLNDSDVSCYVVEGGADRLAIKKSGATANSLQTRIPALLAIAGLAAAIAWLIRSPAAADFLCRWPHAIGVLVGVLWWAWLSPSWLGLAIVAASMWHALRFDWPGRSFRAEASTVLRSTRTQ